jgi:hypothetical protein
VTPAQRGAIIDREGAELAFSVETRTLQVNLRAMRAEWNDPKTPKGFQTRISEVSRHMADKLPEVTEQELLAKFRKPGPFTFLAHNVEPSVADAIVEEFPEIAQETRAYREYPGGTLASNVVGYANWRMEDPDVSKHNLHGLIGLESARDNDLAGEPGRRLVDTAEGADVVIPGTERDLSPAVAGSDLELTLNSDLQYDLQRRLADRLNFSPYSRIRIEAPSERSIQCLFVPSLRFTSSWRSTRRTSWRSATTSTTSRCCAGPGRVSPWATPSPRWSSSRMPRPRTTNTTASPSPSKRCSDRSGPQPPAVLSAIRFSISSGETSSTWVMRCHT